MILSSERGIFLSFFEKVLSDNFENLENLSTVTYGAPINIYAETNPFTDGVSSFFQILNVFF
jgi:hypothetical protein